MGSSMSKSSKPTVVKAEEVITPAVARQADGDNAETQAQKDARARMRGIRSTYNRFGENAKSAGSTTNKLG